MKVIMEPVEMIGWFDLKGVLMPIKFRLETKDHELKKTVKVNKVLYHTEEKKSQVIPLEPSLALWWLMVWKKNLVN